MKRIENSQYTNLEVQTANLAAADRELHSEMKNCPVCAKSYRAQSRFDLLCTQCWADNEMKPYFGPTNVSVH